MLPLRRFVPLALFGGALAWERSPECREVIETSNLVECYPELADPYDGLTHPRQNWTEVPRTCAWTEQLAEAWRKCEECSPGSVRVFSPKEAGITCFRIPAVVQTNKGTLLAFAEARHGGCGDGQVHEIAVRRSTDHGNTWSKIKFAVGSARDIVGNPYPIALRSGRIALVYVIHSDGPGADLGGSNGVIFSDDDGESWGVPADVGKDFGKARGSLPGPGAGVELAPSGRLLVVSHHGAYVADYLTYSDDGGISWRTVGLPFPNMDEATLADLGGGEVLLNMRHQHEATLGRGVSRSTDGGYTWSKVSYDKMLVGPVCQGSLVAFGGSVFFSNQASATSRSHLTVRRSDDGGRTWKAKLELQEGKSAGYSSLVGGPVGDGAHGGILYESVAPGSIDFMVFPLDLVPTSQALYN